MRKTLITIILLLSAFPLFCERNKILYNYDYNRYHKGGRDIVIGLGVSASGRKMKFRNQSTKDIDETHKLSLGLDLDLMERFNKYSFYQNFNWTSQSLNIQNFKKVNNDTFTIKIGASKDFIWVIGQHPFTVNTGLSFAIRIDNIKKKDIYNSAVYFGFSGRLQMNWHISSETGMLSAFAKYEPEFYILTNAASFKKKLSFNSEHFSWGNNLTIGINVNIIALTNHVNNKKADKLMKNITNH